MIRGIASAGEVGTPMVMVTNNGNHESEKYAELVADFITKFDPDMSDLRKERVMELRQAIIRKLTPHFALFRLVKDHDVTHSVNSCMLTIMDLVAGTPWVEHFCNPDVQSTIQGVLKNTFDLCARIDAKYRDQ